MYYSEIEDQHVARQRQERAVRTRDALIQAAAETFDENGFSGAGINRILERAGVTPGAMYFHFKSKEDLARAVIVEQAAALRLPEQPSGIQQLVNLTLYLAGEMQRNVRFRAGVRLAVDQTEGGVQDFTVYEWWGEKFRQELLAARARDELLEDVDEAECARVLVAAYTGTQLMSQLSTGRADLPQQIVAMWRYLLPGIARPRTVSRVTVDAALSVAA